MNYRVELVADGNDGGPIPSELYGARFPIFLHAVAAARSEAIQWATDRSTQVVVNIFDQADRLASRLQLTVPALAANADPQG